MTPLLAELSAPLALLPEWLSPEHIFIEYGLIAILIIIFAETGLLIGFFLPGDTLLLSAGILSYTQPDSDPLWMFLVFVPIAAGPAHEDVAEGTVSDFPETLLRLFRGENLGKLVLKIADE